MRKGKGKRKEGGKKNLDSVDGFSVQFDGERDKVGIFFDDVFNGQLSGGGGEQK